MWYFGFIFVFEMMFSSPFCSVETLAYEIILFTCEGLTWLITPNNAKILFY